jgi:hypothetical protein
MILQADLDPTIARKRRKEIISNLRQSTKRLKEEETHEVESVQENEKCRTKYQNHYEPDIPMTKEQTAEWRKEARRKRNRESAAASRNKVRNRIAELEQEVQEWKTKYSALLERIEALEKGASPTLSSSSSSQFFLPSVTVSESESDHSQQYVSPCATPTMSRDIHYSPTLDLSHCMHKIQVPFHLNGRAVIEAQSLQDSKRIPDTEDHPVPIADDSIAVVSVPNEFHLIEKTSRPAD